MVWAELLGNPWLGGWANKSLHESQHGPGGHWLSASHSSSQSPTRTPRPRAALTESHVRSCSSSTVSPIYPRFLKLSKPSLPQVFLVPRGECDDRPTVTVRIAHSVMCRDDSER